MAEDSSSGSQLSNFQYLAHLLDPYYTPPWTSASICNVHVNIGIMSNAEMRARSSYPKTTRKTQHCFLVVGLDLSSNTILCWGWRVSTLEKKLGFGHAFPFCLTMGYTGIPYVRYVIICTSNFMGSRWLKPHLPHDSLAIPLWEALLGRAELCLETTGATTQAITFNAGCGGFGLVALSKELLIACASVCKRAKRRGPDPMEYLIAFFSFFSLSLSSMQYMRVCACPVAISLQVHILVCYWDANRPAYIYGSTTKQSAWNLPLGPHSFNNSEGLANSARGPPVISWFISPSNYSYKYHKP